MLKNWLFFAPTLLADRSIQPWYLRLVLVILSPFMVIFLIAAIFVGLVILAIVNPYSGASAEVEHNFKSSDEIATFTSSYIPACDTLNAVYHCYAREGDVTENFYLLHPLNSRDLRKLRKNVANNDCWTETDSTFNYHLADQGNIIVGKAKLHFDVLNISIPKKGALVVLKCCDY